MQWIQDRATGLVGAWEKLFLGKDFIYSTGEYVCGAPESGSGVVC